MQSARPLDAAAAPVARADVEGEVRSKDKIVGTIDPGDEVETFRIQCAEGA